MMKGKKITQSTDDALEAIEPRGGITIGWAGVTRRVYRFEYVLAALLGLLLALPLPLMLLRGLTGEPIMEWHKGIPPVAKTTAVHYGIYGRWETLAKKATGKASEFQEAFARSFGGRTTLREIHSELVTEGFGVSPVPEVLIGRKKWLFYTVNDSIRGFQGIDPFTSKELDQIRKRLMKRRDDANSHGARYVFVLAPDKQTAYPEKMPDGYRQIGPSRGAQMIAYLEKNPGIDSLDLLPSLQSAKTADPEHPLYLQMDTHWSSYGAYIGYRTLAEKLQQQFPTVRPMQPDEFDMTQVSRRYGDLSMMIQRGKQTEIETVPVPHITPSHLPESAAWGYYEKVSKTGKTVSTAYPDGEIGKAIIFHDSFMKKMSPYLTRHFRRAVWHWGEYDPTLVAREKPDIVIEEHIERHLWTWTGRKSK
jgi:hypothetical protein